VKEKLYDYESVYSCCNIIEHDPASFWQSFELSDGRRLENVEDSKKYKTGEESFPRERNGDKGYELSRYLVDNHEARIFCPRGARHQRSGRNPDDCDQHGKCDGDGNVRGPWQEIRQCGKQERRRQRGPGPGPGTHVADPEKGSRQADPDRSTVVRSSPDSWSDAGAVVGFRHSITSRHPYS